MTAYTQKRFTVPTGSHAPTDCDHGGEIPWLDRWGRCVTCGTRVAPKAPS